MNGIDYLENTLAFGVDTVTDGMRLEARMRREDARRPGGSVSGAKKVKTKRTHEAERVRRFGGSKGDEHTKRA